MDIRIVTSHAVLQERLEALARRLGHEPTVHAPATKADDAACLGELVLVTDRVADRSTPDIIASLRAHADGHDAVVVAVLSVSTDIADACLDAGADECVLFVSADDRIERRLRMAMRQVEERRSARLQRDSQSRHLAAQKEESLAVLAGGVAHDFNNLLTSIMGYAELAGFEAPGNVKAREALASVRTEAMKAADLARQLLAYAGGGRYLVEPIDFGALVRDSLPRLAQLLPPGARFEVDVPDALPPLTGDAAQLRQILTNLVSNAGESLARSGGAVRLSVRSTAVDREWLAHAQVGASNPEGHYLMIEVSDNGAGMDQKTLERVFDPFFSTKFTGRGLGMPAVLGIVRGHGGAIRIDSAPGHGTAVRVLLAPVPPRAARAGARARLGTSRAPLPAPLVLVADDEPTVLEVVAKTLEHGGFTVECAASGREVVEKFHERAAEVAAVLLDIRMPELDGRKALREMRLRRPDLPALYMSGYGPGDKDQAFDPGEVDAFIRKPFSPSALVEEVRRVISQGHGARPAAGGPSPS